MYDRHEDPREVIPITGRSIFVISEVLAAPKTAPAAWLKDDLQTEFNPYKPPAHSIICISGDNLSGEIKGENETVDTTYLGNPIGSD